SILRIERSLRWPARAACRFDRNMSALFLTALLAVMALTSFVSGIFGMAGGMILMGISLTLLQLPQAMSLHAIAQIASNGWRSLLWIRYVRWKPAGYFLLGCVIAFAIWSYWRLVPGEGVAMILLGASPFLARIVPSGLRP